MMYQGQMCWIDTRSNAPVDRARLSGWFQKLRTEGKGGTYYYQVGGEIKLNQCVVDDSMLNQRPDCPYEVLLVVPADLQAAKCHVDDDLIVEICYRDINCQIEKLEAKLRAKLHERDALRTIEDEIKSIAHQLSEIRSAVDEANDGELPKFYYAYGKHSASGTEYCWRIPYELREDVKPGMTVKVQTSHGVESCVVTRVEISPQLMPHKLVVSVENAQKSA